MHWEERFHRLSEVQDGLVARFQLPTIGCTIDHWWTARRNGRWTVCSDRLLGLRGSPRSDSQRVRAAVLDTSPGAMLHGPTTLAWAGLGGYGLRHLHVAKPWGMRSTPSALATIHRLRAVRPNDVAVLRGMASETPLRAIWTEAAAYAAPHRQAIGIERIGRLLDDAHKLGLVTWGGLAEIVDDIHQRGRAGTVIMRALAEARPQGSSPTESRNESRFEEILTSAGAEPLERQKVLGGHEPIGRSDHRDRRRPLAVEINSEIHHTTPTDRAADERRYSALNAADFTVGIIWEEDIWRHPNLVLQTVAAARRMADRGDRSVLHSPGCPWPDPLRPTHRRHDPSS